jgi:chorismate-pyruvate lyase
MDTFKYSYRQDSSNEPIGRVLATSLFEARGMISKIKRLDIDLVDDLFKIKKIDDHEQSNKGHTR